MNRYRTGKFISLMLRHAPGKFGLNLDAEGWAPVDDLIKTLGKHGHRISLEDLEDLVFTNDKQRFAFSPDGKRIRANQGHSLHVDLGLTPVEPPSRLYHGTVERNLPAIMAEGLKKMRRHHVHLTASDAQAHRVGARHGVPVVLLVHADTMSSDGHAFYCSANGVWLTESVPPRYIEPMAPMNVGTGQAD